MAHLRNNIAVLMLSTMIFNTAYADGAYCPLPKSDCKEQCRKIVDAAKRTISDRDKLIEDQDKTIKDLGVSLNQIEKDRDSIRSSRDSWYHNPFILIPLGILVGGAGALYLERR